MAKAFLYNKVLTLSNSPETKTAVIRKNNHKSVFLR